MQENKVGEQKSFKQYGHFSLVLLFISTLSFAGSFADFKRSQADAFTKYIDERDNVFKNYLEKQFKEYNADKPLSLYEKPKPKHIVKVEEKIIKSVGPRVSIFIPKSKLTEEVKKDIVIEKNIIVNSKFLKVKKNPIKDINFLFYGSQLGFNIDSNIKKAKFYPQNQKGIGNFFSIVASSEYNSLIVQIQEIKKKMKLNDWGLYLLVNEISKKTFSHVDDANLLSWFIFNKLGYSVKVGLTNRHTVLMYYSKKVIYSTPSYKFKDKKYYVLSLYAKSGVKSLYTYAQDYPEASRALNLSIKILPILEEDIKIKILTYKEFGKKYRYEYMYNKNLIDFMATYPQADYETYFNAPLAEKSYVNIVKTLKENIDGMHSSSAINFVLNFVQKAFKYEVDHQQFGREKVMFAQETLYYDKSDCEDRAILFAYLVKKMFKIGVVGVKYSDHMATALYIPIKGDSVKVNGRRFVVADPTYINANIGKSMPKYRNLAPESFILVKK